MIKILLYLSLLFASGNAAGEGVASLDDNQLAQQYGFCELGDSEKGDCNDQEDSASLSSLEAVEHFRPLALAELALHSTSPSHSHYLIRAPPTSS